MCYTSNLVEPKAHNTIYVNRERLDHDLANYEWLLMFTGVRVHYLHFDSSNHYPIWIVPTGLEIDKKKKLFRFKEMWLLDKGCTDKVEAMWLSYGFEH